MPVLAEWPVLGRRYLEGQTVMSEVLKAMAESDLESCHFDPEFMTDVMMKSQSALRMEHDGSSGAQR